MRTLRGHSEKYGTVFTIHIGSRPVLVLCGYETVKEALVDQADDFSGRGHFPAFYLITKGYGVVISNGERWKQLRRFSLITLRNFGMGKRSIEERIQEEAQFLVEELRKTKERAFDPTFFFSKAVSNVICSVVFGSRFDYEDKKFLSLLQLLNDNFRFLSTTWGQLLNRFPGIILPLPGPHRKMLKNIKVVKRLVKEYIKEHQMILDPSNPRDFIDCFLIKMQQETQNRASEFSMKNLVMTTLNLFAAGTETVSTTLRYGLMILLKYPEVEETVHQEIEHVIGESRLPCMEDRNKMPYTEAVIHEIQRFIDIIPLNLPHSVTRDTTFRGYTIPKGTDVIPVLSSVLHDQNKFGNPKCFDPQRFLDGNGYFRKNDAFMPFSAETAFNPTFYFSKAVSNVICSVVFGNRFDYEDKKFLSLLQLLNENIRFLSSAWSQLFNNFPRIIQPLPGPHKTYLHNVKMVKRFVKEYIKEHQETLDPNNPRDFIDCFLFKMQQEKQNPVSEFSMKNLVVTTLDLFAAGTETVSTTLRYGLLIFLKNPEVEERTHQEIDRVIGKSRQPCMDDRSKMPYTEAVIHEIQRFSDIIPLNVLHSVTRDTTFRGYTIPKGMDVIPVLSSVLYDEKMFGCPESFDPNHFMDGNGSFKRNDAFMPFSTGKRICPGERLAGMELFLFFTNILQNFSLKAANNSDNIDLTPEMSGFGNIPQAYQLHLIPRLK
ncbi:hypothetical protein NDU88_005737 [Pleurodeles waltl]|uniref:Uncharacterized protein n=1 Tax=Pleurodeles waltl TaxID=8319 RepID=A0AAV7MX64_PLEWA|nr:hypothetical protein NDU88_005737 [Pleurodeles waltl]